MAELLHFVCPLLLVLLFSLLGGRFSLSQNCTLLPELTAICHQFCRSRRQPAETHLTDATAGFTLMVVNVI